MTLMKLLWPLPLAILALTGCSSSSNTPAKTAAPTGQRTPASSNPVAKYIELVGFRIIEKTPGKLNVEFGVVNHSEADIGDVAMTVNLRATTAKPDDPPLFSFDAKVPGLGPQDLKEVTVTLPSKMRVYELPDWQFIKADFQITEPK
jgi:hypothetical protein